MNATEEFAKYRERRDAERKQADAEHISWRKAELPDSLPSDAKGYVARNGETRAYVQPRVGFYEYGRLLGRERRPAGERKTLGAAQEAAIELVREAIEPKEDEMPTATRKKKTATRSRSATRRAPATEAAATPKQVHDALLREIRKAVAGRVETAENATKRYVTLSKAEKSFGLVFAPGARTVGVKILPRTKAKASDLPKGHGFTESKYGLMRSVSSLADVEVVAKAFAIAAEKGAA